MSTTNLDPRLIVQALDAVQENKAQLTFALVGSRDGMGYTILAPEHVAEWLGTSLSALGNIKWLEWGVEAARSFVRDGDLVGWALAFPRGENHWKVYQDPEVPGTAPLGPNQLDLRSTDLRWIGHPTRMRQLEDSLPTLRSAAFATDQQLRDGVTPEKADARDRLREALLECARLCELAEQHTRADAFRQEGWAIDPHGLRVNTTGYELRMVDDEGRSHPFPPM